MNGWMSFILIASGCVYNVKEGTDSAVSTGGGADPLESTYIGGWPMNPDKNELGEPSWDSLAELGSQVPRFVGVDQYGDSVDLYDFAGHGVPIVLDLGTIYCSPCQAIASYLSDGDMSHLLWDREGTGDYDYYPWWSEDYEGLRQMIADGEVYWITVLFNESESGPSDQEECAAWHDQFPNEYVPVLADADLELKTWLGVESYPTLNLVNSDMRLEIHSTGGPFEVFRYLGDQLAARR